MRVNQARGVVRGDDVVAHLVHAGVAARREDLLREAERARRVRAALPRPPRRRWRRRAVAEARKNTAGVGPFRLVVALAGRLGRDHR